MLGDGSHMMTCGKSHDLKWESHGGRWESGAGTWPCIAKSKPQVAVTPFALARDLRLESGRPSVSLRLKVRSVAADRSLSSWISSGNRGAVQ